MSAVDFPKRKSVAVIGGGWAGCAAAVELAEKGYRVRLFEAGRILGGRARRTDINGLALDNGQHILLGAYTESLRLMRMVGIDTEGAFLRLPMQMRYPPNGSGMDFITARLPAPFHLLAALLCAKGLTLPDKLALSRFSTAARWMGWTLNSDCPVSELLERFDQTEGLIRLLWRPLCIAALNTPPDNASANVFLSVLRDSLGASKRAASDMLLPRVDLTALFPERAAAFIERSGGEVRYGRNVRKLHRDESGWRVETSASAGPGSGEHFDAIVVATPAIHAAALLKGFTDTESFSSLEYEPIATCYLQYPAGTKLAQPFYALIDDADAGKWGQFVFDRGQLFADQAGLLAVVISTASAAIELDKNNLETAIAAQLAREFQRPELASPLWSRTISEKRATFSCTPALVRPGNTTGMDNLAIAGDYTMSCYPATMEAAIRSGVKAALLISEQILFL